MDLSQLSAGTLNRLERIKQLKGCTTVQALEFSIGVGWLAAENRKGIRDLKGKTKK